MSLTARKKVFNFVDKSIIDKQLKDIKLEEVYFFLLERTVRQFRKYAQTLFAEQDITLSGDQWVVLKRISESEGTNQRELAELTYKDPASVTRILDLLEKQSLVRREPVPNDRRTYAVHLTNVGKAMVEKVTPLAIATRRKGLEGLSPEDHAHLKRILQKIYENFS